MTARVLGNFKCESFPFGVVSAAPCAFTEQGEADWVSGEWEP